MTKIGSIHTDSTLQVHVLLSHYKGMLKKLCITCITLEGNCLEHDCVHLVDTNITPCMNSSLHYQTTYWQAWCSGVIPSLSLQSVRQVGC